ncbi:MAG: hypothetical protein AAFQ80_07820 [Cyanobacteria bacterium J06621_8]
MAKRKLSELIAEETKKEEFQDASTATGLTESVPHKLTNSGTNKETDLQSNEKTDSGTDVVTDSTLKRTTDLRLNEVTDLQNNGLTESQTDKIPNYQTFERKEARLRPDQIDQLTALERTLNRQRKGRSKERITSNTLIRIAVDLLLSRSNLLQGSTEAELSKSVTPKLTD